MLKAYGTLLRIPGGFKFSSAGFIGRMPIAMDSLAIIFIVVAATDSYALAGVLTAVGSIVVGAAEVFWSRQADQRGQAKILRLAVPIRIIAFLIFVFLVSKDAPIWTWFVSLIIAESTAINAGGLVRRRWLHTLKNDPDNKDGHLVNTAYSWEAMVDEFVFIVGPVVATTCAIKIAPSAGILAGLIFLAIGLPSLAAMKSTEPPAEPRNEQEPHPPILKNRIVQSIVLPCAFLGGFFGAVGITVVGFAEELNHPESTGWLLAIWAVGSAVAALVNGAIKFKSAQATRFLIYLVGLTIGTVPLLFMQTIPALAVALFINGLFIAPLIVNAYGTVENAVPAGQITEALTWVIAGMPLGGAISSALAGVVIDNSGAQMAFWVPLGFMFAAIVTTLPYLSTYRAAIGYARTRD
ncbi:major facilitator superfamily protein [Candidatus Planktophila limnetica]|uniref:Major facilitator superfamily protein n=1 Tax=Candidatus Planktophila limnetica TaxID=573600 RepID=A0A249LG07_9ACTN|nr:MFS transporter [Candidatus Planktophila limnetica]ASY27864.1 major facilitator superfamily protein [Candidatus Planktophila limnetica]